MRSLRAVTHLTDIKELEPSETECYVSSCCLHLGQNVTVCGFIVEKKRQIGERNGKAEAFGKM